MSEPGPDLLKSCRLRDLTPEQVERLCRRNPLDEEAASSFEALEASAGAENASRRIFQVGREIFSQVERRGDAALIEYTARFDRVRVNRLAVAGEEITQAVSRLTPAGRRALETAADNLQRFHRTQIRREPTVEVVAGVTCRRDTRPIERVGLYIPGGSAVLPSTVLMLGVPARLAGCPQIVLCVPPQSDGRVPEAVLAAAHLTGIREIYRVGGAQAIAAMAIGTESVPVVDKLFGPGNRYVQAAKLIAGLRGVAIDMVAGPSEVLVVADESAEAGIVAADLLSQAEHDADSRAVLVTHSPRLVPRVQDQLRRQLKDLPRANLARRALNRSFALVTASLEESVAFSNQFAPEHLLLQVENPARAAELVSAAGSVFLGRWSPEVAGDYASGANHTLPTSRTARAVSGLSVDSFVKTITFQELTREGLRNLAPTLETLATLEGLEGHRRAVTRRLERVASEVRDKADKGTFTKPSVITIEELVRANIRKLQPYSSARELVQEGILLDANENPFDQVSDGVILNRYPDPSQRRLRRALADYAGVQPANVLAGTGSDEVIDWVMKVFCNPGVDKVATLEPTYGMYRVQADILGIEVQRLRLDAEFDLDVDDFVNRVDPAAKVLFLCSPNNPTGNRLSRDRVISVCRRWGRIVVLDEAYVEFAEGPSLADAISSLPNLIVMRTLSKAFGRAAIRVGYALASPVVIGCFRKVKAPYNLNALSMREALDSLRRADVMRNQVARIRAERERLRRQLETLSTVSGVFPSEANFLTVRCLWAGEICRRLREQRIVIRDRSALPGLHDCFRITVGAPEENDRFLEEFRRLTTEFSHAAT